MVTKNGNVIISLCSHLSVGRDVLPLEQTEWIGISKALIQRGVAPEDILSFSDQDFIAVLDMDRAQGDRVRRLLDRSGSMAFEIERLGNMGIELVTRADTDYPAMLKKKLGQACPPIFYYCGDLGLLNDDYIGVVGERAVGEVDEQFAVNIAIKSVNAKFSIITGGAKGADSAASTAALANGGVAVEFLSDSLIKRIKDSNVIRNIRSGRVLLLSASNPDAGFSVDMAVQRNKYIYAQSLGTVVVKSDYVKGGTWAGAIENLNNNWCNGYCWNNPVYKGNLELIKKGAIAIDMDFNPNNARVAVNQKSVLEQSSLFN